MPKSLPSIRQLCKRAWTGLRPRYGLAMKVMGVHLAALTFMLPGFVAPFMPSASGRIVLDLLALPCALPFFFISFCSSIAMCLVMCKPELGGVRPLFRAALKLFWPFLWLCLLGLLIQVAGFACFFVPGLIASVFICLARWVLVTSDVRGLRAIAISREYVRGLFWPMAWRLLPLGLLLIASETASLYASKYGNAHHLFWLNPIFLTILSVGSIFITPIITAYQWEIFKSVKERSSTIEATDKQRRRYGWLAGAGCLSLLLLWVALTAFVLSSAMVHDQKLRHDFQGVNTRSSTTQQVKDAADLNY